MLNELNHGTLTFILKGEVPVQLTSLSLLVKNQLHLCMKHFFRFQNNPVLISKDKEVSRTNTSPFRIKVSLPWLNLPLLTYAFSFWSEDGTFIKCCAKDKPVSSTDINGVHCAGINIDADDPVWKSRSCMSFVRSQSAPSLTCEPGPTEQVLLNLNSWHGSKP